MPSATHPHIDTSDLCKAVSERTSSLLHCKINITELAASPSLSSYAFSLKAFAQLFYLLTIRRNIRIQFSYCIALHTLPQLNKFVFLEKRDFRFSSFQKFPLSRMDCSFICCWSIVSALIWINIFVLNRQMGNYLYICTRENVTIIKENSRRKLKRQPSVFKICLCGRGASVWWSLEI